jgi:DNA-binding NarL/FixJ family response regulator
VLEARGCKVVGLAGDGREAVAVACRTKPDVVLMDIRMPVMDGIEATRELTAAAVPSKALMLTTYDLDRYVYNALAAGAAASCSRPPHPTAWSRASVCAGEHCWRRASRDDSSRTTCGTHHAPRTTSSGWSA